MTDDVETRRPVSSGAPPPLPTATGKRRRRVRAASAIGLGLVVSTLLTLATLRAVTRPGAEVSLGKDTFEVGEVGLLARRVAADDFPLLFQDLRNGELDIFVDHRRGASARQGWLAFSAHAPGAPRRCQLDWDRRARRFVDPCDGEKYERGDARLRSFVVRVTDSGLLVIDLRTDGPAGRGR